MNYFCKIASHEEISDKFDYEIERAGEGEKQKWREWKKGALQSVKNGERVVFFGLLDGKVIAEGHAALSRNACQNSDGLVDEKTAYLFAFRTVDEFQGHGYFSKLFSFILATLKEKGYKKVTLGVEPDETKNLEIYKHLGFDEFLKRGTEFEPDGTKIPVDYYARRL